MKTDYFMRHTCVNTVILFPREQVSPPPTAPSWKLLMTHFYFFIFFIFLRENVQVGCPFDEHPGGFGTLENWSDAIKHCSPLILCTEEFLITQEGFCGY